MNEPFTPLEAIINDHMSDIFFAVFFLLAVVICVAAPVYLYVSLVGPLPSTMALPFVPGQPVFFR